MRFPFLPPLSNPCRNRLRIGLAFFSIFAFSASSASDGVEFLEAFRLPLCKSQYSQSPIASVSGGLVEQPHGDVYCLPDHRRHDRLIDLLRRVKFPYSAVTDLRISATYITATNFAKELCDLGLSDAAEATLYVQKSTGPTAASDQRSHFAVPFFTVLRSCVATVKVKFIGCDVFPDASSCPEGVTNSHHVKSLFLATPERSLTILGSGNFSDESLRYNIEDWVGYIDVGSATSASMCIFTFLDALEERPSLRFAEQKEVYRGCLEQTRQPPVGVEHVMLPFEHVGFVARLNKLFRASQRIVIAAQFLESKLLFRLIRGAKHARITIILDDAYYYTATNLYSQNFIGKKNARDVMRLGEERHVDLRFLQTNHHYEVHGFTNTVHLRTVFFEDKGVATVMVGSAHLRDGAWRHNTEVQVFLSGKVAAARRDYLKELLERSVSVGDLPQLNVPAYPAKD